MARLLGWLTMTLAGVWDLVQAGYVRVVDVDEQADGRIDFTGETERPSPSSDPAEPSLPAILAKAPVVWVSHLGCASPVESPDDGSPGQNHVEQTSIPLSPATS